MSRFSSYKDYVFIKVSIITCWCLITPAIHRLVVHVTLSGDILIFIARVSTDRCKYEEFYSHSNALFGAVNTFLPFLLPYVIWSIRATS